MPAFPENYKLDPKRALYCYLKKQDLVRVNQMVQEKRMFLHLINYIL